MSSIRKAARPAPGIVAFVLSLGVFAPALADGVAFKGGDLSALFPAEENEQIAAIHCEAGVQRMIIAINFDAEDNEQGLWMFPVPAKPETVQFDIQAKFPAFNGYDPRRRAGETIRHLATALRAWELLPLVVEGVLLFPSLGRMGGIDIHAEVDKWGIHAEVLEADSAEALDQYLSSKGANVDAAQLLTIAPYLDGNHALIVTWITSLAEVRKAFPDAGERAHISRGRTPTLYVEFPTERAYFPLKPTSAYGSLEIPLRLYVAGFVEPSTNATAVTAALDVEHLRRDERFSDPNLARWATGMPDSMVPYTRMMGTPAAADFTDDLWFDPVQPPGMAYADVILAIGQRRIGLLLLIVLLVGLSYVSGGITGMLVLRRWSTPAKLACWNVLTWVGLRFALRHHNLTGRSGGTEAKLRRQFSYAFMLVFLILSVVLNTILAAPLWLIEIFR